MTKGSRQRTMALAAGLVLTGLVAVVATVDTSLGASGDGGWFVSFDRQVVSPVGRGEVTRLVDIGTIQTDGFNELVFSLGGEFKQGVPSSGRIGALLIPDQAIFDYLLRKEGKIVFPLEAMAMVPGDLQGAVFVSEQQTARVAFPAYRVYLYNETDSSATVGLFVYRTR